MTSAAAKAAECAGEDNWAIGPVTYQVVGNGGGMPSRMPVIERAARRGPGFRGVLDAQATLPKWGSVAM